MEPLHTSYRGWEVRTAPNGQGIAALMMLNMLERFPMRDFGRNSHDALHTLIEIKKLAYADLERYVGRSPMDQRARGDAREEMVTRAALVDPVRARCDASPATCPGGR